MSVESSAAPTLGGQPGSQRAARTTAEKRNAFIASFLGWMLDGFETYTVVLVGHAVTAKLISPTADSIYFGGILAMTLFSWACGGLISGIVSDYLGRRRTLMVAILWYAVFTGLTALSGSFVVFMIFRFFAGLGLGAEWGPGSALVSEIWPDRSRGRGIALLQGGFGIGFLIATGLWQVVNTGPNSWRWMFVIGIAPAFINLFVWLKARDPEIWVASDERRRAARERKQKGHAAHEGDDVLNTLTIKHILGDPLLRNRTLRLLMLASATLIGWWAASTYLPQFAGEVAAKHGLNVQNTMTLVSVCYNGGGVLGYFAMGWFNDRFGRRITTFSYFLGAMIMNPIFFKLCGTPGLIYWTGIITGFFTLGNFTWIATWPVELYPTPVRATAITLIFNSTRFIAAAFAVLSGILVSDVFGDIGTTAAVIGAVYLLGVIFTFTAGPETKGKPLPD